LIGIFIVLHGLVHLWYLVLSQKLVAFQPGMGFTGKSWIFTHLLGDPTTRLLASVYYGLAAGLIVVGGAGWLFHAAWARPILLGAGIISSAVILLFWDGSVQYVVEKGLVGLLISMAIPVAMLLMQ
jgi:hypothetical protein